MQLGDLLEWLAAVSLVLAAYLWRGVIPALLALAVALAYFAQCYDHKIGRRGRKAP